MCRDCRISWWAEMGMEGRCFTSTSGLYPISLWAWSRSKSRFIGSYSVLAGREWHLMLQEEYNDCLQTPMSQMTFTYRVVPAIRTSSISRSRAHNHDTTYHSPSRFWWW